MRILSADPLADRAFTLELDTAIGQRAAARVRAAGDALGVALADAALPGVQEITRSFTTVTVHYDPLEASQADLLHQAETLLSGIEADAVSPGRLWRFPCCYAAEFALDLDTLSQHLNLSGAEIIAQHAATEFGVYAIGFLPGLPFMGDLPPGLSLPRRSSPRPTVPAGSVAIAGGLCVIYPWDSPGGWHILGRCPVPLFDPARPHPALLQAGDRVRFADVSTDEYARLRTGYEDGSLSAEILLEQEPTA
ncbi:Sporulation inhibitor KipI [Thalassovita gelatinovora]|uniref:Sporulation inhibitor KipI n=1 Tax=Thalassovita gelatinovora TaxID=53501 RepID=A0A0P1FHH3_THAGE|nr:5-oxoprolinase subunit PxpB [Thalassovita gelatinovora]QIZ81960.1 5-oxoprolinase subunit PxpB [Thalassovita gelatinovora]CUH67364.1 Sporulation inhibitor KipI [Thalassovita gelatinovora]SEP75507.1 sensor histidine kinase inhibitor, KipI family [Thalassovita gelatinovora]